MVRRENPNAVSQKAFCNGCLWLGTTVRDVRKAVKAVRAAREASFGLVDRKSLRSTVSDERREVKAVRMEKEFRANWWWRRRK